MLRQRLYGLGLLLIGAASVLPTGDATAALVLGALGLWMLCGRQYILYPAKKKGAPAAATADALAPKRGTNGDTHSIAQTEEKCK